MGCLKIFIAVGLLFAGQLGAVELSVYRQLPFRVPEVPNDVLASDPIIGRLACPPMVQYNLLSKSFSSQLFTDIAFSADEKSWSLTVGPGVRWWSGEQVNNVAVANYLEKYLKKILQTEYRYENPKFTVTPKSTNQVSLKFFSKEFYGPYLLSGHPMVRKKGRGYECTGDFSYQAKDLAAIALKKRPHASGYRYDGITLSPSVDVSLAADGHWLRARQQVPNIHGPRCERTIDYSIFTQIVWNTTLKPTDSIQVRRLLDQALPRTHLINHVMHGQANLVTGPWIRVHPGYDDRLNFTPIESRLIKEKVRSNSLLKHAEINICLGEHSPFIENLLLSAFESYGLKVKFKRAAHRHSQKCHGYLEVFDSIWPEYKHIYTWLSRPEWGSSKKDLQEIGIKYLKTMSYGQPNFSYLKQIHERLFRRSLVSVLMQHKACIDVGKYADIRGDQTKYGTIITKGFGMAENLKIPYDPAYFAAYLHAIKGYDKDLKTFEEGKGTRFYGRAREASIMLPRKLVEPYYKDLNKKHVTFQPGGHKTEFVLSAKTMRMLETIKSVPGCQYAYVHSQKVLKSLGPALQKMGFEIINLSHINDISFEKVQALYGRIAKPRVVLYHPGNMQYPDGTGIKGSSAAEPRLKKVLQFFKSRENSQGQFIKAIIGTPFEGLDMSYLRAVHILAPLPTLEDDEQAVGRALRFCGHLENQKTVSVYRYFGIPPKEPLNLPHLSDSKQKEIDENAKAFLKLHPNGINAHVFEDARRRGLPMKRFMECVKAHSKECEIDAKKGGLLGPIQFGEKIRCGMKRCKVELTKDGALVIPKERAAAESKEASSVMSASGSSSRHRNSLVMNKPKIMKELERRRENNKRKEKIREMDFRRNVIQNEKKQRLTREHIPVRKYHGPYKLNPIFISKFDRRRYE